MIVEMVRMSQTLVVLLHVVQDSFNVTILTVFFQCIFAIEMMIVVTDLMKKVALNILAMENNSSAWKKMLTEQLSLHFVFLLTEGNLSDIYLPKSRVNLSFNSRVILDFFLF